MATLRAVWCSLKRVTVEESYSSVNEQECVSSVCMCTDSNRKGRVRAALPVSCEAGSEQGCITHPARAISLSQSNPNERIHPSLTGSSVYLVMVLFGANILSAICWYHHPHHDLYTWRLFQGQGGFTLLKVSSKPLHHLSCHAELWFQPVR